MIVSNSPAMISVGMLLVRGCLKERSILSAGHSSHAENMPYLVSRAGSALLRR